MTRFVFSVLFDFFTDACQFQSLNTIENVHLRAIFLMLRTGLRNQDIPRHTKLRSHIIQTWDLHVRDLKKTMRVGYYMTYYIALLSVI